MSTLVDEQGGPIEDAFRRGREDHQFFAHTFLGRTLHDSQLEFITNAEATVNVLACSNRWGKTTLLPHIHFHSCFYKAGAEARFLTPDGDLDPKKFITTKYETVHTASEWELASLTWDEALKMVNESPNLQPFIKDSPRSIPPHIDFINGARWKFRTLGHNAQGVDGKSIHVLTVDEAGWIPNLQEMIDNVLRVRIADVRGRIVIVGTFKPGVSRDFYKIAARASSQTGAAISFDHKDETETEIRIGGLPTAILKYLEDFGVNLQELENLYAEEQVA